MIHHCGPEITDCQVGTFSNELCANLPACFSIGLSILCAATFVYFAIRAVVIFELVFVYGWRSDEDNPWVVSKDVRVG